MLLFINDEGDNDHHHDHYVMMMIKAQCSTSESGA